MPIVHAASETVSASPQRVFDLYDDLPRTAEWLPPCVSLAKVGAGPNQTGDRLKYIFREGGRTKEMDGEIVERIPGERLRCRYWDPGFEVAVDLRVAPHAAGARMDHEIAITPLGLFGKLLSPLIRLGLKAQTRAAMANLKRLVEAPA